MLLNAAATRCAIRRRGDAMHRLIDVTLPMSNGPRSLPGDPPFELGHMGTHVDAPAHFLKGGATVDQLPLEILVGKARVLEVPGVETIARKDLEKADLRDDIRLLLKTRMSAQARGDSRHDDSVALSEDAATYLVQAGIKLVGFDDLSIDPRGTDPKAHQVLLGAGVIVVEGLDLAQVEPGDYDMTCLPLRLVAADGAPARVVLRMRP